MAILALSGMATLTGSARNASCVLPILDLQTPLAVNQNEKLKISSHNQFFTNNTSVGNLGTYNNYFGTGIDGDVTVSSSAQISSSTSPAGLNNPLHGDVIIKNYKSLTINAGILFSPLNPCRGLLIYCTGDLTVNGTISMTGKGGGVGNKIAAPLGIANVTDARYDLVDATIYVNNVSSSAYRVGGKGNPFHWNWAPSGSAWFSNYKIRAAILSGSVAGGAAQPLAVSPGNTGAAGINCCGGGGGGAQPSPVIGTGGSPGGRGTIFAGGGGGGEGPAAPTFAKFETAVGNGAGSPTPSGVAGTGGLLILIVRGNITVNNTISNNGVSPGPVSRGGSSGGGRTIILYGGTYTNLGTVSVTGGAAGGGTAPATVGGAGGAGALTVRKIHT
jgi:hypothetical protein